MYSWIKEKLNAGFSSTFPILPSLCTWEVLFFQPAAWNKKNVNKVDQWPLSTSHNDPTLQKNNSRFYTSTRPVGREECFNLHVRVTCSTASLQSETTAFSSLFLHLGTLRCHFWRRNRPVFSLMCVWVTKIKQIKLDLEILWENYFLSYLFCCNKMNSVMSKYINQK